MESVKAVLCNDKPRHLVEIPTSSDKIQRIADNFSKVQQELKTISLNYVDTKKQLKNTKSTASVEVVNYFKQQNASSQPLELSFNGQQTRYFLRRAKKSKKKSVSVADVKNMVQSVVTQLFSDEVSVTETLTMLPQFLEILIETFNNHRAPDVSDTVILKRAGISSRDQGDDEIIE